MFIITSTCDFKCEREAHCKGMCQNSELAQADTIEVNDKDIVYRYLNNDITKAIVFGGLEPFDQFEELFNLISLFRQYTNDIIILYTGYYKQEIEDKLESLKQFDNIIIKYHPRETKEVRNKIEGVFKDAGIDFKVISKDINLPVELYLQAVKFKEVI